MKKLINKIISKLTNVPIDYCCPNCDTNWVFTKRIRFFIYQNLGINICVKCFNNPKKINPDKIYHVLLNDPYKHCDLDYCEHVKKYLYELVPIFEVRKNKLKKINKKIVK